MGTLKSGRILILEGPFVMSCQGENACNLLNLASAKCADDAEAQALLAGWAERAATAGVGVSEGSSQKSGRSTGFKSASVTHIMGNSNFPPPLESEKVTDTVRGCSFQDTLKSGTVTEIREGLLNQGAAQKSGSPFLNQGVDF